MKPFAFTLTVAAIDERTIVCTVCNGGEDNRLCYTVADGDVSLTKSNVLGACIQKNTHQLQKILRSAIEGKLHVGQTIRCVLIDDFQFLQADSFAGFIRLDRRNGKLDMTISDTGLDEVHKIYADGSCDHENGRSGYGGFTESPDGTRAPFYQSFEDGSSNLMELLAINEGLHRLVTKEVIQINSDSQFVIRGMVQWVHFWRHNNWQTAYGRDVRYTSHWKQAYRLCDGKRIEFKWIKGHSHNEAHDLCHHLAKAAAQASPELPTICSLIASNSR